MSIQQPAGKLLQGE